MSVVELMNSGQVNVTQSSEQMVETSKKLSHVKQSIDLIIKRVSVIGSAINKQELSFNQVNESYQKVDIIFNEAHQHSDAAAKIGTDINKLGDKLMGMVDGY